MEAQHSICVLPFDNMSGEPEQEYFSDGISEDIITDLSKVSALSVVARNTAFTFKGESVDVKEVAQKARRQPRPGRQRPQGGQAREDHRPADRRRQGRSCLGRPLRPRPHRHLRDPGRDLQSDRRRAQGQAAAGREEGDRAARTTNVEAYNIYLMARQQWISGNFGDTRRDEAIVRLCEQATELDPNYAEAWALMALAQAELFPRKDERAPRRGACDRAQSRFAGGALHQGAISRGGRTRRRGEHRCGRRSS